MKAKRYTKLFEWQQKAKQGGKCDCCGKEKELNVEHIIPVSIMSQLGLQDEIINDEENFELFCFACNRYKGSAINIAHPKTKGLLLKYVNSL